MIEGENVNSNREKNRSLGKNCKFYKNSEIIDSVIGDFVIIGNDSIVQESTILGNNSINRRNFIHRSTINRFTYTGLGSSIRSSSVGKFCSISWGVSIGGGDHPHDKVTTSTLSRFYFLENAARVNASKKYLNKTYENQKLCLIKNDVLISTNAIVLRDVTIGNGAVIGAGAVVTKDVDPYTIVAGVPAKPIRKRFPDHIIEALLEIQWWDWPIETIKENIELIYSTKVDDAVIDQMKEIAKAIK